MRYSIGAEVDNDPRARPDAQNIVDAMRPDGLIRSVHFLAIDHPAHGAGWQWPFDNPEFVSVFDVVGTERVGNCMWRPCSTPSRSIRATSSPISTRPRSSGTGPRRTSSRNMKTA